jgi:uncharacterized NAD-dependent epimerase/dehydratase family protein
MQIEKPYLMFIGDVQDQLAAKTAAGIVDWRRDWCVGQLRLPGCKADLGLQDVTVKEGRARGANTMVVGVVNAGGVLPDHWIRTIVAAIQAGMDIASGLHRRLEDVPEIADAAREHGRRLHDVRIPSMPFSTGKGTKRSGMRLLTVGTDCSVGKKYTALALEREMQAQGLDADFRATGQTGILISGRGVAVDAVVADFISGAAEWLTPDADPGHWDVVEGQGSLFHPSFAGVTLGLLHGSQPDAFVVCHEPTRRTMRGVDFALPTIRQVIEATLACGRLTNPEIRCVGLAVNTAALGEEEARRCLDELGAAEGLPASDPVRFGVEAIVRNLRDAFSGAGAAATSELAPEARAAPVPPVGAERTRGDGGARGGDDGHEASPGPDGPGARSKAEAAPALEPALREASSREPSSQEAPLREPLTQEALPQEALPQEALPQEALPQGALSQEPLPQEALPQEPLPQDPLSHEPPPRESLPQASAPEAGAVRA